MHLHHDPVGSSRNAGVRHGRNHPTLPCGVAWVNDDREMRQPAQDWNGIEVEGVARGGLKGSNAALAEDELRVSSGQDVLRGEEPLLNRPREASLQHHGHARSPDRIEEREVLHVASANLKHVGELGHHINLRRLHHLRDDGETRALPRLREEAEPIKTEPLEGVRRGARLEGPAAEEGRPCVGYALRNFKELVARFNRAGARHQRQGAAADQRIAHFDNGWRITELT